MGCDRGGNYKKKNKAPTPSDDTYSMKVKCPFRMRSIPSGDSKMRDAQP